MKHPTNLRHIHITLTKEQHERLTKAKGDKTWTEVLLAFADKKEG